MCVINCITFVYVGVLLAFATKMPWEPRPRNCNTTEFSTGHIFHLPTHEGLISHFNQLEKLYIAIKTKKINKTIVELPFTSSQHFENGTAISLCNIFVLPKEIECSCATEEHIGQMQKFCPIIGSKKSWSTHPSSYGLDANRTKVTMDIDLRKENCIAGMLNGLLYTPRYGEVIKMNPLRLNLDVQFTAAYLDLAHHVRIRLGQVFASGSYLAAHWRRGDQLTTRCVSTQPDYRDSSANCGNVSEFLSVLHRSISGHHFWYNASKAQPAATSTVYIATNEKDPDILQQLHSAGLYTAANISAALGPALTLREHDLFVVELILMCQASRVFYWGNSGVHSIVEKCRARFGKW